MVTTIYRLLGEDAWAMAQREGVFRGSEHDVRDGFIHFSSAEQLAETAAKHYAGRDDLVLLWVSTAALGAALRWEISRGGALFPHLYGPLAVSAVKRAVPVVLGADGHHIFPSGIE
ncbi:MAG TPA: DUF952 domain-containing protein [Polyangiaceae bacterium]|nr:DUF952 domain-containing protein [Polyangiaceae bacterium]